MANNPSSAANSSDTYPNNGINGRILPSGYAHFADSLQEQINRGGASYITIFPSGWDERGDTAGEYYGNLNNTNIVAINESIVSFPIHTSGINLKSANSSYTAAPAGGFSTMSNMFG
jgi:hypothetical protein